MTVTTSEPGLRAGVIRDILDAVQQHAVANKCPTSRGHQMELLPVAGDLWRRARACEIMATVMRDHDFFLTPICAGRVCAKIAGMLSLVAQRRQHQTLTDPGLTTHERHDAEIWLQMLLREL